MHLGDSPRSDIGPIMEYLKDATKLPPEVVRPEQLLFELQVDATPASIFETASQRVEPEYIFVLRRLKGYVSVPQTNDAFIHGITFNIRDQGRARGGIFNNAINMAVLANSQHDMVWDTFYAFVPGSDVIVEWTIDAARVGANALITGVSITGDLVRVRRLDNGTLVIPGVTDGGTGMQQR
jgi:hypothetical protein